MRVRANAAGHVGNPITVTRHGREVLADYIYPGDEFEWEKELGSWMVPADGSSPPPPKVDLDKDPDLSRAEIITRLNAAGIQFFKGATTEALKAQLPDDGLKSLTDKV